MALFAGVEQRRAVATASVAAAILAATSALTSSAAGIGAAIVVCIALASYSPLGALCAVIATLPWFHRPLSVGEQAFATSEVLLACAVTGAALKLVWNARSDAAGVKEAIEGILVALSARIVSVIGVLSAVGLWLSVMPFDSAHRSESLREWRWVFAEPLLLMLLLGIFANRAASRQMLALALVLGASGASAQAILDLAGGGVTVEGVTRISGPFPHPNALALMVTRVAALAVAWIAFAGPSRRMLGVSASLTIVAVVLTFSRGAWASMMVAALLIASSLRGWSRRAVLIIPGIVIAIAAVIASDRMLSLFGGGSGSLRLSIWRSALRMIAAEPIRGYGPDQFLYAYLPRYVEPVAWQERFSSHAHNLILDFWIRLGIIGGAFAVGVVIVCLFSAVWIARRPTTRDPLAAAATVAIVALVVHGLVDDAYFSHELAMSGWLLALLAYHPGRESAVEGARSAASPRFRRRGFHWIASVRQPSQRRP